MFRRGKTPMMTCPTCGREIPTNAVSCRYCGVHLQRLEAVQYVQETRVAEEQTRQTDLMQNLEHLAQLKRDGLIDEDEYRAAKAKLLG